MVPWGHWKTTTFVAALRVGQIAAPCVFNGPMDGPSFRAYVEQFVVPILRPGDIVVMDNLPSHKVAGIRQAIEAAGAKLRYLPAYSPDFTPSNSSSPNSKPCCERPPPEPSKPSSQQSPKPSTMSARKSAKTTSQTKAIAANHENALDTANADDIFSTQPIGFSFDSDVGTSPINRVASTQAGNNLLRAAGYDPRQLSVFLGTIIEDLEH